MRRTMVIAALILAGLGSPLRAQEPPPADSLRRELERLRARMDSLEQVVRQLTAQRRDTAAAGAEDELAALRAAAAGAGGGARADTAAPREQTQFVDRARNLNQLNPEISVTGDVRLSATRANLTSDNADIREFEFGFQSPLDPYSSTKIFASIEEGQIGIEEAYAYWTGLPGSLRLDVGRFRQQVGELNRWHLHALSQSEYPLVLRRLFSDDGLIGDGVGLYWMAPVGGGALGAHELWGQVTLANNPVLFDGGRRLSWLGHLNNFWQVSRSTFFQIGGSVVYGQNPDSALTTRVFGVDARVSWRPPERALYRNFTLRGEGYQLRKTVGGIPTTRYGGYAAADYQLSRRLFAGVRYDYVQSLSISDTHEWAVVPSLTWWQSEWVFLRGEWQRTATPIAPGLLDHSDRFLLQAVWSIGPHKHEIF